MPNYEYRCLDCGKRFEVYMSYDKYGKQKVTCPYCQSENITRKIGRIRFARSDESRMEEFSDVGDLDGLEDDPVALGRMMRKMSKEVGEEMPPEFNEVVGRLESGQSPEDIERDLPDIGSESGGMDGFGGSSLDDFGD
jgi:putative FmdB family regulatory protein